MSTPGRLVLILAGVIATAPAAAGEDAAGEGLRLLFIGNSLTYSNELPEMVGRLLERAGVAVGRIESRARPNFGLSDHWRSKKTMDAIASGDWDIVILQQGPSATEGRPSLLEYSRLFASEIRKAGARPALYMVWPSAQRLRDFPGVVDSYRAAAGEIDGRLFPVGEAWLAAWQHDPKLELYGRDGFHPSRLGTYLAALVIYQQLSGRDPRELPPSIPGYRKDDPITPGQAQLLQAAAAEANAGLVTSR